MLENGSDHAVDKLEWTNYNQQLTELMIKIFKNTI
jgi:hypothetical protein